MSYEKREKNRKKRKLFRVTIILSIFIYLIFRSVPSLLANNAKTVQPEEGTLIEKISAQGFVIMDETIIKAKNSGELERTSIEGERLAAGVEVANVNSLNDTSYLKQELETIDKSISALKKSENETKLITNEKEKIEDFQLRLVEELQNNVLKGNLEEIYILKEQLALYDSKAKDISFSNTLVGQSIENLKDKRNKIDAEIKSNHIKYYTNHGGIISYKIDGYEEFFLPKDFENYTYDRLNLKSTSKTDEKESIIAVEQPICKIIDNFEWYVAIKIEDLNEVQDFELNQTIRILINGDKQEVKGKIIAINPYEDKGVLVLKLNTMLHHYYDVRFPEIEIIKYKKEGYKIPTKSIVDKDNLKGVYIKDKSSIVKFRPVIIIGEDKDYTYVNKGDSNGNIQIEGEDNLVKTITLFDEIFLNTNNIKEGQILN